MKYILALGETKKRLVSDQALNNKQQDVANNENDEKNYSDADSSDEISDSSDMDF